MFYISTNVLTLRMPATNARDLRNTLTAALAEYETRALAGGLSPQDMH